MLCILAIINLIDGFNYDQALYIYFEFEFTIYINFSCAPKFEEVTPANHYYLLCTYYKFQKCNSGLKIFHDSM